MGGDTVVQMLCVVLLLLVVFSDICRAGEELEGTCHGQEEQCTGSNFGRTLTGDHST